MEIHQLRNATVILCLGEHRILVDPMLSEPGALPGFKLRGGGRRRNPLLPMPENASALLESVTAVLVTHEHPDHLDQAAIQWIKARSLPVWASPVDAPNLSRKGLAVRPLVDGALGLGVELIPARHGRGIVGWLMGPVAGVYLAQEAEPSLLMTGDATLSPQLVEAVARVRPEVIVAPAGAANFGFGPDILFSLDELVELVRIAPGQVVLNHLEALDHCPMTRRQVGDRMREEGLAERVHLPEDGACVRFECSKGPHHVEPVSAPARRPGPQKWLTSFFTGTR